jgi:hypothetical protein
MFLISIDTESVFARIDHSRFMPRLPLPDPTVLEMLFVVSR